MLINSSRIGQTVLLTVEGNRVYATQSVVVKQHSTIVHVPLPANYGPNVFLIRLLRSAEALCQLGGQSEKLRLLGQQINVKITADRETANAAKSADSTAPTGTPKLTLARYSPGDKITYRSRRPTRRAVRLRANSRSASWTSPIYALREDDPGALRDAFYPRRINRVSTEYSFAIRVSGRRGQVRAADRGPQEVPGYRLLERRPCAQTPMAWRRSPSRSRTT